MYCGLAKCCSNSKRVSFCKLGFKDALATYIPSPVMLPDIAVHVYRANPKRKTKSSTSSASSHDLWLWTFTMYFSCDWILTQHAKCILFDVGVGLGVRLFYRAMWCQEQQLMTTLKKEWWLWSRCSRCFMILVWTMAGNCIWNTDISARI